MSHTETTLCDTLIKGMKKSTSYLLGFWTTHVKGGSRSSHFFYIIKVTCNSCVFDWGTQACIQAIGTRDVTSKWVSKYTIDLEWSSLSTSTKTGAQHVIRSFPVLESGSCIWSRDAWVKYLFWGNLAPKAALFPLWLATTSCPQTYTIDLIFFPLLSKEQVQLPVWQTSCP